MALFKPKQSSGGGGNKFTGICETHIVGFKDRSAEFDWADVFIEVEVGIKDSEYTRNIRIRGSFDKDDNGNITGGSVINRMYKFFGDIGCLAGITIQGKWELEDGTAIEPESLDLSGKLKNLIMAQCDAIGYMFRDEDDELMVSFKAKQAVEAGSRCNHLKGQIFPFNWNKIYIKEKS